MASTADETWSSKDVRRRSNNSPAAVFQLKTSTVNLTPQPAAIKRTGRRTPQPSSTALSSASPGDLYGELEDVRGVLQSVCHGNVVLTEEQLRECLRRLNWTVNEDDQSMFDYLVRNVMMKGKKEINQEEVLQQVKCWRYWQQQFLGQDTVPRMTGPDGEEELDAFLHTRLPRGKSKHEAKRRKTTTADDTREHLETLAQARLLLHSICINHPRCVVVDSTEGDIPWSVFIIGGHEEADRIEVMNFMDETAIVQFEDFVVLRLGDFPSREALWAARDYLLERRRINVILIQERVEEAELVDLRMANPTCRLAVIVCSNINNIAEEDRIYALARRRYTTPAGSMAVIDLMAFAGKESSSMATPRVLSVINNMAMNTFSGESHWHRSFSRILNEDSSRGLGTGGGVFEARFIYETPLHTGTEAFGIELIDEDVQAHSLSLITEEQQFLDLLKDEVHQVLLTCDDGTSQRSVVGDENRILSTPADVQTIVGGLRDVAGKFEIHNTDKVPSKDQLLVKFKPLIWYFGCHGTLQQGKEGRIRLELNKERVTDDRIVDLCTRCSVANGGKLAFVFLNLCNSEGLAERLFKEAKIPFVIYWADECLDEACQPILERFFRKFRETWMISGGPLAAAVTSGFDSVRNGDLFNEGFFHDFPYDMFPKYGFASRKLDANGACPPHLKRYIEKDEWGFVRRCELRIVDDKVEKEAGGNACALRKPVGDLKMWCNEHYSISVSLPRAARLIARDSAATLPGELHLSPVTALSLTHPSRERANIPANASYYAFCHRPSATLAQAITQLYDTCDDVPLYVQQFLSFGGFVYFKDDRRTICKVNVLAKERLVDRKGILTFSLPQHVRYDVVRTLLRSNRLVRLDEGKLLYGWISPREELVPGAPLFDHGAFVLVSSKELLNGQVFPVVRSA